MLSAFPVTLYPSRQRLVWFLLLALVFVGLGSFLIWLEIDVLWGWLSVGFFGFGAVVIALQFHPRATYLTLDEQGFTMCSLFRKHRYEWRYIEGFGTYWISLNHFVGWDFTPDYPQRGRALDLTKGLCGYEAGLPETYGLKADELCTLLNNVLLLLRQNRNANAD